MKMAHNYKYYVLKKDISTGFVEILEVVRSDQGLGEVKKSMSLKYRELVTGVLNSGKQLVVCAESGFKKYYADKVIETIQYPIVRELDGVYFRVERDGKWLNLCFSDMTESERMRVMDGRDTEWLKSLCNALANALHEIGDEQDLYRVYE